VEIPGETEAEVFQLLKAKCCHSTMKLHKCVKQVDTPGQRKF